MTDHLTASIAIRTHLREFVEVAPVEDALLSLSVALQRMSTRKDITDFERGGISAAYRCIDMVFSDTMLRNRATKEATK